MKLKPKLVDSISSFFYHLSHRFVLHKLHNFMIIKRISLINLNNRNSTNKPHRNRHKSLTLSVYLLTKCIYLRLPLGCKCKRCVRTVLQHSTQLEIMIRIFVLIVCVLLFRISTTCVDTFSSPKTTCDFLAILIGILESTNFPINFFINLGSVSGIS